MKNLILIEKIQSVIKKIIVKNLEFVYETNTDKTKINAMVEKIKNPKMGDFTAKFLFNLKIPKTSIDKYAVYFKKNLSRNKKIFKKIEFVEPGFLNMTLQPSFVNKYIVKAFRQKNNYGKFPHTKQFYNLEFVSANPTGHLHLGHARNAAYGDSLSNIWKICGINVNKEFFINDGGNQIDKLAESTYIRYLQLCDVKIELPDDSYHGKEIIDIAQIIKDKHGKKFVKTHHLTPQDKIFFKDFASSFLLNVIKETLVKFGVEFDIWFHESAIYKNNLIPLILKELKPYTYTQDNATFLRTTEFGDDKDRVLIKSDGSYTYFTPDIVYHKIKLMRRYDKLFNIFGADHGSYVKRLSIALQMLGAQQDTLTVMIQQMVKLTKDGEEFKMSKRSGNSLTIADMLETIGKDAARWFLVSTSLDSHLEIDVDKVKKHDNNNPIYYVQYAHARINQIILKSKNIRMSNKYDLLNSEAENEIKLHILSLKPLLLQISKSYSVHLLCAYLTQLAKMFHSYYANNKIIDEKNRKVSSQRLAFAKLIQNVLAIGMRLLGITPSEKME